MGNTSTKRIGTFDDFCKAKKKQLLKESNEVAIDVPFYTEAIESVLGDLHCIAGDPISWGRLLAYIKIKYLLWRYHPGRRLWLFDSRHRGDGCEVFGHSTTCQRHTP